MELNISIKNVQHVTNMNFDINATEHGLKCIVGKNGVGKTTLIKCIRNFVNADTFSKTSDNRIFSENSQIIYNLPSSGFSYQFDFDKSTGSLDSKVVIPNEIKEYIDVELPIPHGERFDFFQSISKANDVIVKAIAFASYTKPNELIELLNSTYSSEKFNDLIEIEDNGNSYYCLLLTDGRYVREDYLSSGEYFLISLYKKIKNQKKIIVIDELDISLDAAAQVFLVKRLREFSEKYSVNIIFTTHSLAIMRTLNDGELFYLTNNDGDISIDEVSYNYVKSILFGFDGWDKYILTEDQVLEEYLEYLISNYNLDVFYKYKIIYVGGATNVVDLMKRNKDYKFLSEPENVICILDGDQKDKRHVTNYTNVFCIPQESVEKELYNQYNLNDERFSDLRKNIPPLGTKKQDKKLYENLISGQLMSKREIQEFVTEKHQLAVDEFVNVLKGFLGK